MKTLALAIVAVLLLSVTHSQTKKSNNKRQQKMETQQIVSGILHQFEDGWNSANGHSFAEPFTDSSEFVDIRGTLHQHATRRYLGEAHQGVFVSIYKDSKISYHLVQSQLIDDNTILANAKADLEAPAGPLAGKSSSTISMVIIKSGNDWKVRSFHNTLVAKQ